MMMAAVPSLNDGIVQRMTVVPSPAVLPLKITRGGSTVEMTFTSMAAAAIGFCERLLFVHAGLGLFGVRRFLGGQNLAADIHQTLDVRVLETLVFGLDVVDLVVVLDVGVEPGDQGGLSLSERQFCSSHARKYAICSRT